MGKVITETVEPKKTFFCKVYVDDREVGAVVDMTLEGAARLAREIFGSTAVIKVKPQ